MTVQFRKHKDCDMQITPKSFRIMTYFLWWYWKKCKNNVL